MKRLTILLPLVLMLAAGCDATKQLTITEDAVTGVGLTVQGAYNAKLITKADVQTVRPKLDAARDACLSVEADKAAGVNELFWPINAATSALSDLESQSVVVKAHAVLPTTQQTTGANP